MPDFTYVARSKDGRVEKDIVSAANTKAVADLLHSKMLMPTSIRPARGQTKFSFSKPLNESD